MFNTKLITAFSVLTLASSAFAMTDAQLTQAMQKDLGKYLVTVKSPKLIFHWVDASDINPPKQYNVQYPSTAAHYKAYVEKAGKAILSKRDSRDDDVAGQGLYAATDPLTSRSYGGMKSFGLIVGKLRAGAKVIPGNYSGLRIDNAIIPELAKRGCSAGDYIHILDTYDANCAKIKPLLLGTDISFASGRIYNFGSQPMTGCRDIDLKRDVTIPSAYQGYSLDTFVVYNANLLTDVFGYTHKTALSGNKQADDILSYLKGLQASGIFYRNIISKEQMNDPAIKTMSQAEIEKFSQTNIFGCVR